MFIKSERVRDGSYDIAIYIGRFQPFHDGHKTVINEAKRIAPNVIVLIGSSGQARTIKNPWTFEERSEMIIKSCGQDGRIITMPTYDKKYNDNAWVSQVQDIIQFTIANIPVSKMLTDQPKIALIGHFKDDSSYYLNMFPQWDLISVKNWNGVDATKIRAGYFNHTKDWADHLTPETAKVMNDFNSDIFMQLKKEFIYINKYRESWAVAPYPPTFVTADAVVTKSGHVLLVKRGRELGVGLWAMPGGFVNQNEYIIDAAIRELREETRIAVPVPTLKEKIESVQVFDNPTRSERGRIITHCHLIVLPPDGDGLPKVKGGDDADKAAWIPHSQLSKMENICFEDHYYIIKKMLGLE